MILDDAIAAHVAWKIKLRAAASMKEKVDEGTIGRETACELGAWLAGEGGAKHGNRDLFQELVKSHSEFHRQAGQVAAQINAGRYDRATEMLEPGTPYATASSAVGMAILRLQKEVGGHVGSSAQPTAPRARPSDR